jgi:Zn-finger nucleic acid-binding protein
MIRVDLDGFRDELARRPAKPRVMAPDRAPAQAPGGRWIAYLDGAWTAPMALPLLAARTELSPDTWVRPAEGGQVIPAYRQPQLFSSIQHRYNPDGLNIGDGHHCPKCHVGLVQEVYEGTPLDTCPACHGRYVTTDQLSRVLMREDYQFPEAVARLAQAVPPRANRASIQRAFRQDRRIQWRCPKCQATMHRKFYSVAYFVDVEQCVFCGLTWLDHQELELLQYLYEHRTDEHG